MEVGGQEHEEDKRRKEIQVPNQANHYVSFSQ